MGGRGGRPPGRELVDLEARHLRHLYRICIRDRDDVYEDDQALHDFVLELTEAGVSSRVIARQLGLSPQAIQGWVKSARARRDAE